MSHSAGWIRCRYLGPVVMALAGASLLLGSPFYGPLSSERHDPESDRGTDRSVSATDDPIVLRCGTAARYDLGPLDRGGRVERPVVVHNPGPVAVVVTRITSSCECLRVDLADRTIGPGQSTAGTLSVDLRSEPGFAGGLLLRAEGWADGKAEPAVVIEVGVNVR